jgi:putative transposase
VRLLHRRPARQYPGLCPGRDRARNQAHQVKFIIRDRGSNYTAAFDAVLAGAGIRTVLCNVRTPLNAAAPLKPLPEPIDLDQHRLRRQTRAGGMINEYRLVA